MPKEADEQEIFAATDSAAETPSNEAEVVTTEAEKPAVETEQPTQTEEQEQPDANASGEPEGQQQPAGQDRTVPYGALKEEREARKAEAEARKALEQQVQQMQGQLLQMTAMLKGAQPQQPGEPEAEPVFWDDPDAAISRTLTPLQQQNFATRFHFSERFAKTAYGEEAVSTAKQAFDKAMAEGRLNPDEWKAKLTNSMDPVEDIVRWHQQDSLISEVGSDPEAWRQRERERIRQEVLAEANGGQPTESQPRAPNGQFTQAPTQGLPSLNRAAGTAGTGPGAITEDDIFNAAPAFGKKRS